LREFAFPWAANKKTSTDISSSDFFMESLLSAFFRRNAGWRAEAKPAC
jgi:hypothetical protein